MGITLKALGDAYLAKGDLPKADGAFKLAKRLLAEVGDLARLAEVEDGRAALETRRGDRAAAGQHDLEAIRLYEKARLSERAAEQRARMLQHGFTPPPTGGSRRAPAGGGAPFPSSGHRRVGGMP